MVCSRKCDIIHPPNVFHLPATNELLPACFAFITSVCANVCPVMRRTFSLGLTTCRGWIAFNNSGSIERRRVCTSHTFDWGSLGSSTNRVCLTYRVRQLSWVLYLSWEYFGLTVNSYVGVHCWQQLRARYDQFSRWCANMVSSLFRDDANRQTVHDISRQWNCRTIWNAFP